MNRKITYGLAVTATFLAVALSVASAWGRASCLPHQILLAGVSAFVVVSVHIAPAYMRSVVPGIVLWPFWTLCLAVALFMHASFITAAGSDAAAARLASSPAAAARADQRAAIEQALDGIKARPAGQIARQLSWSTDEKRVAALQIELQEAQRADTLRAQLVALSAGTAASAASATTDQVDKRLAAVLGITAESVALADAMLKALLLEFLGMLLWFVALSKKNPSPTHAEPVQPQSLPVMQQVVQFNMQPAVQSAVHEVMQADVHQPVQMQSDDLSRLRAAVERGDCAPTLTGIRTFMRCSQGRAGELRRALLVQ